MGEPRGQQAGDSVAKVRVSSAFWPNSNQGEGFSTNSHACSSIASNAPLTIIEQLIQKQCLREMWPEYTCLFSRLFLVPQAVRELVPGNKLISTGPVFVASNIRDGHLGKRQWSATTRDVRNVTRPIRHLSLHTLQPRSYDVRVFLSRRKNVPRPSIWLDISPVGVHRGSKTGKTMGTLASDDPLPVPGRLTQCTLLTEKRVS